MFYKIEEMIRDKSPEERYEEALRKTPSRNGKESGRKCCSPQQFFFEVEYVLHHPGLPGEVVKSVGSV